MNEILSSSLFFGMVITVAAYLLGRFLQQKFHKWFFNPMLVAVALVIVFLLVFRIDYETYNLGGRYVSFLLTPATVCLAIPLYQQLQRLKDNLAAILCGTLSGVLSSMGSILVMCVLFRMDHDVFVTLLPKSITTAIAMGVIDELGGYTAIGVAAIVITGILGNVAGEGALRLFRITDPVAKGIAMGSAAHAIGTAKALEMGETEGAMSSLAIVLCGLLTVAGASVFAMLY